MAVLGSQQFFSPADFGPKEGGGGAWSYNLPTTAPMVIGRGHVALWGGTFDWCNTHCCRKTGKCRDYAPFFGKPKHWVWRNPEMCPHLTFDFNVPPQTLWLVPPKNILTWKKARKGGWTYELLCCKNSRLQLNWSEDQKARKGGWAYKNLCCKYSRLQLNWSEVTVSVLNGNKFGMMKNDEKRRKTMKREEKLWKTKKNNYSRTVVVN